jgi:hypothetical protein
MAVIQARVSAAEDTLIRRYTQKHKISRSEFLRSAMNEKLSADMRIPVFGCAQGQFKMAADFDEPLEDFREYT